MAGKIGIGIFIIFFLFFCLKSCAITVWNSPKMPEIYSTEGQDGRVMSMIFLPKHEAMIWNFDPANGSTEGVLTKMCGLYGTHYFWRLWHMMSPGTIFGYRICPPDTEPVNMEITVLERFMKGRGYSEFPKKGERTHQILLFGKDAVKFHGMWLRKEPDNPAMVQDLLAKLGGSKEK